MYTSPFTKLDFDTKSTSSIVIFEMSCTFKQKQLRKMSKRNQKIIQGKIEAELTKIVEKELGKKKFKKTITSLAKDFAKKINKHSKSKIKNKAAKVWKP